MHTSALGLDAPSRLGVVGARDTLLLAFPHLQSNCPLTGLREQLLRIETAPDLRAEAESVEPAGSEHDGVQPALAAFTQARVDVAPERLDGQRRLEREQLRAPPRRRRPDAHRRL